MQVLFSRLFSLFFFSLTSSDLSYISFHSSPDHIFRTTLIDVNKRLWLELESGNKSLLVALNSAKKIEADLETLKKEKAIAKKSAKGQVTKLEAQVGRFEIQVRELEAQVDQLKDELAQSQAEAEEGKRLGQSQLILGFQVMKEALKIVEPDFFCTLRFTFLFTE